MSLKLLIAALGRKSVCGIVEMDSEEDAIICIMELNNAPLNVPGKCRFGFADFVFF